MSGCSKGIIYKATNLFKLINPYYNVLKCRITMNLEILKPSIYLRTLHYSVRMECLKNGFDAQNLPCNFSDP